MPSRSTTTALTCVQQRADQQRADIPGCTVDVLWDPRRDTMTELIAKDPIDQWLLELVPGRSFVDIGGIGMDSCNERVTLAAKAGASVYKMADIRPGDHFEWENFRSICRQRDVSDVVEIDGVDIRNRESLARIGRCDIVHSTGILYHVPSPAEVLWNLRSITGRYLITNTVTFPGQVTNEYGTVELPHGGVLFGAALTDEERRVLSKHYHDKFGWTVDQTAPRPGEAPPGIEWIEDGEFTCWPYWYLYTDHAFRCLLTLCRLNVLEEWKWADHTLQVLCELDD